MNIDDYKKIGQNNKKFKKELHKMREEARNDELIKGGNIINFQEERDDFYGDCESIYSLNFATPTILYIIVLVVGSIFNDKAYIWAIATFIWIKSIFKRLK